MNARTPLLKELLWFAGVLAATLAAMLVVSGSDVSLSLSLDGQREASFGWFIQHWGKRPVVVVAIAAAALLAHRPWRLRYPLWARAGASVAVQYLLHPALATNLLKLASGRPRPVHLGQDGLAFAPFYDFAPGLGDFSFPSGHVAIAMVLAPAALLLWREQRRVAAAGIGVSTLAWAAAMAYGRVQYGAHFPTDVAFSIGFGVALAPLSLRLGERWAARLGVVAGSRSQA